VLQGAVLVVQIVDEAIIELLPNDPVESAGRSPLLSAVFAVLWILYVLRSKRVRSTFLPPPSPPIADDMGPPRDRFDELLARMK
jgi:hypothetical protein